MWSMRPRELYGLIAALLGGRLRRLYNDHGIVVLSTTDPLLTKILPGETSFSLRTGEVAVYDRIG